MIDFETNQGPAAASRRGLWYVRTVIRSEHIASMCINISGAGADDCNKGGCDSVMD